ncbi:MAG: hypothetical protein AMXMBFR47_31170 [Planctomycetota bacterium]
MLHSLINLPRWARTLAAIAGLTVAAAAFCGFFGGQPAETIALMVGATLITISQLADLRPNAGRDLEARILRWSTKVLLAIVVGGWVFVFVGLIYLCVRHGTIFVDS